MILKVYSRWNLTFNYLLSFLEKSERKSGKRNREKRNINIVFSQVKLKDSLTFQISI